VRPRGHRALEHAIGPDAQQHLDVEQPVARERLGKGRPGRVEPEELRAALGIVGAQAGDRGGAGGNQPADRVPRGSSRDVAAEQRDAAADDRVCGTARKPLERQEAGDIVQGRREVGVPESDPGLRLELARLRQPQHALPHRVGLSPVVLQAQQLEVVVDVARDDRGRAVGRPVVDEEEPEAERPLGGDECRHVEAGRLVVAGNDQPHDRVRDGRHQLPACQTRTQSTSMRVVLEAAGP